jgi:alkylation response protein AidB-like acyl-CoA dehydrogenase
MDLTLNEQQKMLQATVAELMRRDATREALVAIDRGERTAASLWGPIAQTGLLSVLIPEAHCGAGGGITDAAVVFEELGKGPVPGLAFSSGVLAALLLQQGGTPAQQAAHLPAIAEGQRAFALALTEPEDGWAEDDVRMPAVPAGDGFTLTGVKPYALHADGATHLLVAARLADGVGFFAVAADAPGVAVRPLAGFATGLSEVRLDGVRVGADALVARWPDWERTLSRALPVLSAYAAGALERVAQMSLDYSRNRVQFQQPIGRFQRVQDHIIDLVNQKDAARWTAYEAAWKADTGKPEDELAAASLTAAAVAKEAYYLGCNSAHDAHAGIGIVREYGLSLHTQMSRTLYHFLGGPRHQRHSLGAALGL